MSCYLCSFFCVIWQSQLLHQARKPNSFGGDQPRSKSLIPYCDFVSISLISKHKNASIKLAKKHVEFRINTFFNLEVKNQFLHIKTFSRMRPPECLLALGRLKVSQETLTQPEPTISPHNKEYSHNKLVL